jgi:hypothetical protein
VLMCHMLCRFLEEVQNDPWGASKCHSHADRLEELQDSSGGGGADLALEDVAAGGGAGAMMGNVQDSSNAVVVINTVGIMVMVNKVGAWACVCGAGGWGGAAVLHSMHALLAASREVTGLAPP